MAKEDVTYINAHGTSTNYNDKVLDVYAWREGHKACQIDCRFTIMCTIDRYALVAQDRQLATMITVMPGRLT